MIGHMKNDGKLNRNWLKGREDDAFHALLYVCGYNLHVILRKLWFLVAWITAWFAFMSVLPEPPANKPAVVGGQNRIVQVRLLKQASLIILAAIAQKLWHWKAN
jgi:hypothetical protein